MSVFFVLQEDGSYGLTAAGYALSVVILLVVLILGSSVLSRRHKMDIRQLAFSGMALALAFVLSMVKLIHMPLGGSVTLLSMLFVTMIGYWYGLAGGLTAAVAYGFLQMIQGPYIISLPQLLVDYILAFGALGLSGLFCNKKKGLVLGYLVGVLGRYVFSVLSGVVFFADYAPPEFPNAAVYSMAYNGAYMGLEALITVVILLLPPVEKAMRVVKRMAAPEEK